METWHHASLELNPFVLPLADININIKYNCQVQIVKLNILHKAVYFFL